MPPRGKRAGSASRDDSQGATAPLGVGAKASPAPTTPTTSRIPPPKRRSPAICNRWTRRTSRGWSSGSRRSASRSRRRSAISATRTPGAPTTSTWRPGVSRSARRHMHEDRSSRASSCTARRWRTASTTDAKLRELLQLPRGARWLRGGCSVPGGRLPGHGTSTQQHLLPAVARATAACFCDM